MAAWPGTLPDFAVHRISGRFGEGRSFTQTDSGFVQSRVISSDPPDPIEVSADYTGAQMDALRTFYFTTLEGGTQTFTHVDLFTGAAAVYRFKPDAGPPSFSHIQAGRDAGPRSGWFWRVDFTLEQMS